VSAVPDEKKPDEKPDLEGEGSYRADRKYREDVHEFLEEEDPEKLARQAERDVEKDPDAYRKAEDEGKRRIAEEDPNDAKII
jgi:hypothetical protein